MIGTTDLLADLKPARETDRFICRRISGGLAALERILNALPADWQMRHLYVGDSVVVIFERPNPTADVAGAEAETELSAVT